MVSLNEITDYVIKNKPWQWIFSGIGIPTLSFIIFFRKKKKKKSSKKNEKVIIKPDLIHNNGNIINGSNNSNSNNFNNTSFDTKGGNVEISIGDKKESRDGK